MISLAFINDCSNTAVTPLKMKMTYQVRRPARKSINVRLLFSSLTIFNVTQCMLVHFTLPIISLSFVYSLFFYVNLAFLAYSEMCLMEWRVLLYQLRLFIYISPITPVSLIYLLAVYASFIIIIRTFIIRTRVLFINCSISLLLDV